MKQNVTAPILSVLMCTIEEREPQFTSLLDELHRQCLGENVELLFESDNKQMSVGAKRQKLLERAQGKFIAYIDDDDWPYNYYIQAITEKIERNPDIDCIGINVFMTTNGGHPQRCLHRLGLIWEKGRDGWDYHRNITHFNPVLREKALQAGFKDMRFGEDLDYCNRLNPLLSKEEYIHRPLFHYRYNNSIPHHQKYGIHQ